MLIPAHNETASIADTVAACLTQTHTPERVIVVDDNSTDDTAERARAAGATVIRSEAGQKAKAQNAGLRAVTTEYVVSIDADTRIAPNCVERLMERVTVGEFDAVCGAVHPKSEQRRSLTVRARDMEYALNRVWLRRSQAAVGRMFTLSGAVLCLRTEKLRGISGFPETGTGEDAELTWVAYEAKLKVGFAPAAVAYTEEPETLRVYIKQMRRWASDSYQVIARHKKHLSKPACALVVGAMLWDTLVTSGAQIVLAYALIRGGVAWAGFTLLGVNMAVFVATLVAAATQLGWAATVRSVPARMVVSAVTRWVYVEAFLREWVLGRRLVSWTGRQGNKAVMTPMPKTRRRFFSGATALTSIYTAIAVLAPAATVMEVTDTWPTLPAAPVVEERVGSVPAPEEQRDQFDSPEPRPRPAATSGTTNHRSADPPAAGSDSPRSGTPQRPARSGKTPKPDPVDPAGSTPTTEPSTPSSPPPSSATPTPTPSGSAAASPSPDASSN